jgi:hypothetical protein
VIGLYQEPGWETVTALFLPGDNRFAIFAIAPESRACGSYPNKPDRTISSGLPTIRPESLFRRLPLSGGNPAEVCWGGASLRERMFSESRRLLRARPRLWSSAYLVRPMRRRRSSKRGSLRSGSSRGSTPTEGIQSERAR